MQKVVKFLDKISLNTSPFALSIFFLQSNRKCFQRAQIGKIFGYLTNDHVSKISPFYNLFEPSRRKLIYVYSYSDSQKHESSCLLSDCFSCISLEPLELKKIFYIYLHPCLKSWSQNQLMLAKTLFCQKKVSYWKKSAILKNSKTLFSWM